MDTNKKLLNKSELDNLINGLLDSGINLSSALDKDGLLGAVESSNFAQFLVA